jgi:hypothetical protein
MTEAEKQWQTIYKLLVSTKNVLLGVIFFSAGCWRWCISV